MKRQWIFHHLLSSSSALLSICKHPLNTLLKHFFLFLPTILTKFEMEQRTCCLNGTACTEWVFTVILFFFFFTEDTIHYTRCPCTAKKMPLPSLNCFVKPCLPIPLMRWIALKVQVGWIVFLIQWISLNFKLLFEFQSNLFSELLYFVKKLRPIS